MRFFKRVSGIILPMSLGWMSLTAAPQVQERFPKPDFQSDYVRPELKTPAPRSGSMEILDVAVLAAALALATYFAYRRRSRPGMFVVMAAALAYFGFYRKGCVCSIGAVQNIGLALADPGYAVPLTVLAFFLLPLLTALFFGRTFCAAVCPLGAVQDVVVLKPARIPERLSLVLGMIPVFYLGLAVLYAVTGAGFIICRYDPFVGFFRLGGSFNMILLGAFLLLLGTVVARPFCRFLCPYAVLLKWLSRISRRHVRITPSECINCRLCEDACPFGAIKAPDSPRSLEPRRLQVKRLAVLLALLPLLAAGSGWLVSRLYVPLSRQHFTVVLAERILAENQGRTTEPTDDTTAFRASGKPTAELYDEARAVQGRIKRGGWILGAFFGLVLGVRLIRVSLPYRREEYDVDTGDCLSCGRCFEYCPYEQLRRGQIGPGELEAIKARTERESAVAASEGIRDPEKGKDEV